MNMCEKRNRSLYIPVVIRPFGPKLLVARKELYMNI